MQIQNNSIILIGMPGAGKSTVGVLLAKKLAKEFIDTDLLIQTATGKPLQAIVDSDGYLTLRDIEASILTCLTLSNAVIATGGSAVYSVQAMQHLQSLGTIVYLQVPLETLLKRVTNLGSRGLACAPGQNLVDLYRERAPLYEKYQTITIDADLPTAEAVVDAVCARLNNL